MTAVLLVLSVIFGTALAGSAQFPVQNVPQCNFGDSNCIASVINNVILKLYSRGLRDLNLVSLDPLKVESIQIDKGGDSPVKINLNFRDVDILELSKANVRKVEGFKENYQEGEKYSLSFTAPRLVQLGTYTLNGTILAYPVQGTGFSNMTLENVRALYRFTMKPMLKDGEEYMQIDKYKFKLDTTRLYMYFDNILFGDATNLFLNENWEIIYQETRDVIEKTYGQILKLVINTVFSKFPYKQLFAAPAEGLPLLYPLYSHVIYLT